MTLSIVVVNWNTRDLLRECLSSIEASTFEHEYETIVIDNASQDGSAEVVQSEFPGACLLAQETNLGYAKGNNVGFQSAVGDYVLTLNPDTVLEPDTLTKALARMDSDKSIGVLGARLIGLDGQTQASVRGFPTFLGVFGDALGLSRAMPGSVFDSYRMRSFDYSKAGPAPQPMGTFLMFRRDAMNSLERPTCPFDESFPIFFNEVDLLARMKESGWKAYYDPAVSLRHVGGAGTRQVRKSMIWESHRSLVRYMRKHSVSWWNVLAFPLFAITVYAAAFIRAKGYHAGFRP